jgi:hypothetical protein
MSRDKVPAPLKNPLSGKLEDSNAYGLGRWLNQKALPKITGPLLRATKDVDIGGTTIPGGLNALLTGAGVGAVGGGLINKLRGGSFGRGAAWGAGIGGLGLGALGHMTSGDDWAERTPVLNMFVSPKKPSNIAGHSKPITPGGSTPVRTYDEVSDGLPRFEKNNSYKQAAWGHSSGANTSAITSKIYRDAKLTLMQKQELTNQVKSLNAQQANRLSMLVGGAMGGGVGLIIAKYLLGLGKFGTILTTIASGLMGAGMSRSQGKPTHDMYGRQYYM